MALQIRKSDVSEPLRIDMTHYGTLELCACGCTQQVHTFGEGECGNQNCPVKCQSFQGTGKLHESAFCKECTVELPNCLCVGMGYDGDDRYEADRFY